MSTNRHTSTIWWLAAKGGEVLRSVGSFKHGKDLLAAEGQPKPWKVRDGLYATHRFFLGTPRELQAEGYTPPSS